MNWLTLTPAELIALFTAVGGLAVVLYLLHRRPRLLRVSTLRFWRNTQASAQARRRRIREPWALLAQLLFLLLVLLALANPRWGGGFFQDRNIVLLVDTSIWSQLRPSGGTPWIEQVRGESLRVIGSLAASDRVLLLRTEADAAPVMPFTSDRDALHRAIRELRPSDTVAQLPRALSSAASAVAGRRNAVIVYVGPGMLDASQARGLEEFRRSLGRMDPEWRPQFLVRLVGREAGPDAGLANHGITRLGLRRDPARPDRWHMLAQVKNYGPATAVQLQVSVSGRALHRHSLPLKAGETANARAEFTWADGGLLEAELSPADALAADDRAIAHLPVFRPVRVAVISPHPQVLKPVLAANPYLQTDFLPPGGRPAAQADIAVYDAVSPPAAPADRAARHSIVFSRGSEARQVRLGSWNAQHPVTRWVRTRDISVSRFAAVGHEPGDAVLAAADGRPLIVAREREGRKTLLVGFDPRDSNFPLQPAFPLLLAAAVEWMAGPIEEMAESAEAGEVRLPGKIASIAAPSGRPLPFAQDGGGAHVLAFETGLYQATDAGREGLPRQVAVNPPALPFERWSPTGAERAAVPPAPWIQSGRMLWRWLVLLAILPLWLEWFLYYRRYHPGGARAEARRAA